MFGVPVSARQPNEFNRVLLIMQVVLAKRQTGHMKLVY